MGRTDDVEKPLPIPQPAEWRGVSTPGVSVEPVLAEKLDHLGRAAGETRRAFRRGEAAVPARSRGFAATGRWARTARPPRRAPRTFPGISRISCDARGGLCVPSCMFIDSEVPVLAPPQAVVEPLGAGVDRREQRLQVGLTCEIGVESLLATSARRFGRRGRTRSRSASSRPCAGNASTTFSFAASITTRPGRSCRRGSRKRSCGRCARSGTRRADRTTSPTAPRSARFPPGSRLDACRDHRPPKGLGHDLPTRIGFHALYSTEQGLRPRAGAVGGAGEVHVVEQAAEEPGCGLGMAEAGGRAAAGCAARSSGRAWCRQSLIVDAPVTPPVAPGWPRRR
jgi:hypothetical protein